MLIEISILMLIRICEKSTFKVKVFPPSPLEHVLLLPWGVVLVLVCCALISNFMSFEKVEKSLVQVKVQVQVDVQVCAVHWYQILCCLNAHSGESLGTVLSELLSNVMFFEFMKTHSAVKKSLSTSVHSVLISNFMSSPKKTTCGISPLCDREKVSLSVLPDFLPV